MGLRFRKSINVGGGFRINLSKSGVGYSWGVPGYRITKTAKGNTRRTYSIPGTGVSYSDETRRKKSSKNRNSCQPYLPNLNVPNVDVMENIDSGPVEQFQSAEYQELTEKISKIIKLNTVSNILLCCVLLAANPIFLILPIIGVILKIVLHTKGKIDIEYTIGDDVILEYKKKTEAWLSLNNCSRIWQVIQFSSVSNRKINAGASRNINRIAFKFTKKTPFYLSINIDTVEMKLKKEKLILLPDKVLVIRGSKVGAVNYNSISIAVSDVQFIESGAVPKDAQVIDHTWQFVNKNGSPDKRFKNNRRLPICLYAGVKITSPEGLNVELQCSNTEVAQKFAKVMEVSSYLGQ